MCVLVDASLASGLLDVVLPDDVELPPDCGPEPEPLDGDDVGDVGDVDGVDGVDGATAVPGMTTLDSADTEVALVDVR